MAVTKSKQIMDKLFAQVKNAKAECEFIIDDNQKRYQDSWLYFRKLRPANIEPNKAVLDYVEPVLQTCVNVLTPQVLDIFTENDQQAVIFRNQGFKKNPLLDSLINTMVNRLVLRENDGYKLLENSIKDALISGDAFLKVFMEEDLKKDKLSLSAFTPLDSVVEELKQERWSVDLPDDFTGGKKAGKYKAVQFRTRMTEQQFAPTGEVIPPQPVLEVMGDIPIKKLDRHLRIINVGLQDLIFDTTCGEEFEKCRYICHKNTITVGEGMAMGYSQEDLEASSTINRLSEATYSKVNLVTGNQITTDDYTQLSVVDPLERKITLDEHYIYSSIPTNGKDSRLYQVICTDNAVLDYKEIRQMPFVHMQMEIVPDSFFGGSLFDRCKAHQDALSTLIRLSIRKNIEATYNKHIAWKGQYDKDALQDNSPGVIIEVDQPGAVTPYVTAPLDQSYQETLNYLSQSSQQVIGTTTGSVSTEDGIPANTAAATVAMILANEGLKSKVVAKTIARTGIAPLMKAVYEVMRQEGYVVNLPTGEQLSADTWPEVYDFIVDINTQRDDLAEKEVVTSIMTEIANFSQVQSTLFSPTTLFNYAQWKAQNTGVDMSQFLADPSQQQVDPEQARQAQIVNQLKEEFSKLQVDEQRQKVNKLVAEISHLETQSDELVRNGVADRETKYNKSLDDLKKQMAENDIKNTKNQIDAFAVKAETNLAVAKHNNEAIAQKQEMRHKEAQHTIDITIPRPPTGHGGLPNGVQV